MIFQDVLDYLKNNNITIQDMLKIQEIILEKMKQRKINKERI